MKRIIAVISAAMLLLLCGCTESTAYDGSDVRNVIAERLGYEFEEVSEDIKERYGAKAADALEINGRDYNADFENLYVFVFPSRKDAVSFLNNCKNGNIEYTEVIESGENFCYLYDGSYCDAYGDIYVLRENNVIFLVTEVFGCWYSSEEDAEQMVQSNNLKSDRYHNFCDHELPLIAGALKNSFN